MFPGGDRTGCLPLPTGFTALNEALGTGGYPRGAIVEIFGPASSGKTALALQSVAHLQRNRMAAAWIDADHAFDAGFATLLGVATHALPVASPHSAEDAFEMARQFAASGAVELVVVDSAAALVPSVELDTGLAAGGLHVRVLGSELRRLARVAARTGVCILFLNQTRIRAVGVPGELETSAGGAPLKLYAAVRIALAATGRSVRFRVLKNKPAAAFRSGTLEWHSGLGFLERH